MLLLVLMLRCNDSLGKTFPHSQLAYLPVTAADAVSDFLAVVLILTFTWL